MQGDREPSCTPLDDILDFPSTESYPDFNSSRFAVVLPYSNNNLYIYLLPTNVQSHQNISI